jgi:hypothetical protein
MGADVVVQGASYGLELVDALTGGPLLGPSTVVETSSGTVPHLVNASRWVFATLPAAPATFAINADFYVGQTVTTGGTLPNPKATGPGYLATVTMMPRTGYPFPLTLTRVLGRVTHASLPVPGATVTLSPAHYQNPQTVVDGDVIVTTTDDGQYTYWFLPQLSEVPPIANQLTGTVSATIGGTTFTANIPSINLVPNGVTNVPTVTLP